MKFCKFLKIMNCYIGQERSQYDFMYVLFSKVVCEPFSEEDVKKEEEDKYYPFSKLCSEALAKKVYSGNRVMPKALARFVKSHYEPSVLIDEIDNMSDIEKQNLLVDFGHEGVECNIDDVSNVSADIFFRFIEAAIEERDDIDTGIKSIATAVIQCGDKTNHEILLLEETSNFCPICGKQLLKPKQQDVVKRYKIVRIFPENISRDDYLSFNKIFTINGQYNSFENLMVLCTDCAIDYEAGISVERFKEMVILKRSLMQRCQLIQSLENIDIEHEIFLVIQKLVNVCTLDKFVPLSLDALRVEQKIEGKHGLLINRIRDDVIRYYKFIEEQFRIVDTYHSNTFERIAGEVKLAYEKMEGNGIPQDQIFEELINWMTRKLQFEDRNRLAISIVISFFVQNCEVFHEIT